MRKKEEKKTKEEQKPEEDVDSDPKLSREEGGRNSGWLASSGRGISSGGLGLAVSILIQTQPWYTHTPGQQ